MCSGGTLGGHPARDGAGQRGGLHVASWPGRGGEGDGRPIDRYPGRAQSGRRLHRYDDQRAERRSPDRRGLSGARRGVPGCAGQRPPTWHDHHGGRSSDNLRQIPPVARGHGAEHLLRGRHGRGVHREARDAIPRLYELRHLARRSPHRRQSGYRPRHPGADRPGQRRGESNLRQHSPVGPERRVHRRRDAGHRRKGPAPGLRAGARGGSARAPGIDRRRRDEARPGPGMGPARISHRGASPGSHGGRGAAGGRGQIRRRVPGEGSPARIAMTDHSDDLAHLLLQEKIENFLYWEAELLDERRYEEWLALLAEDVRYWMPMRRNVKFGELEREFTREGQDVSWFDEGKDTLERRVQQILTGVHWAEEPLSRICHMVSNVQLLAVTPSVLEPADVTVKSRFLIYRNRVETETDILIGKREDVLHRVDGQWKIRRRKIVLDQNVLQVKNLTFFF